MAIDISTPSWRTTKFDLKEKWVASKFRRYIVTTSFSHAKTIVNSDWAIVRRKTQKTAKTISKMFLIQNPEGNDTVEHLRYAQKRF